MLRRLIPGGLRAQLAIAIAVATAVGICASFLAVYRVTGSRLRAQIDSELRTQVSEWTQSTAHADLATPGALTRAADQFIAAQRYHAESLLIVVQVAGGPTVSNNPKLLAREEAREQRTPETTGLLDSPSGLATASVAEAGGMRVLSTPIKSGTRTVGTLRVANPLTPVQQAQSSLRRAFLIVGALALLVAIAVGIGLASLIAEPLRRMARVAAAVDAGDLSVRSGAGAAGARGEVAVLSETFDNMLERLERAFKRQRDFVSDASHELRTPLAVLRAQVELLDRETDEGKRLEGTATLLRRLDELDRLVADMLTLASAEAGQLIEPEEIDLHDYFEDLRRDLPLFGDRDFQLQPVELIQAAQQGGDAFVPLALVGLAVEQLNLGSEHREWGAELVRGVRDEVSLSLEGSLESLEHVVECLGEHGHLAACARGTRARANGQIAGVDRRSDPRHASQRFGDQAGKSDAHGDRDEERKRSDNHKGSAQA